MAHRDEKALADHDVFVRRLDLWGVDEEQKSVRLKAAHSMTNLLLGVDAGSL